MGSCFLAATRALTALLIALACTAQAAPFVYVTQPSLGSVAVIDAAINTVAATIGVGDNPRGIAITRSGTRGYTANITSDTVTFLDLVGNSAITTVPVASLPIAVALSADETRLFVASYGASVLSVIDIASRSTITTIPLIARPGERHRYDHQHAVDQPKQPSGCLGQRSGGQPFRRRALCGKFCNAQHLRPTTRQRSSYSYQYGGGSTGRQHLGWRSSEHRDLCFSDQQGIRRCLLAREGYRSFKPIHRRVDSCNWGLRGSRVPAGARLPLCDQLRVQCRDGD